jgi:hypothetical protein
LVRNKTFLHQHGRENDGDFQDRIARSYYLNYCKTIIHIYKSHIGRKTIKRNFDRNKDFLEFSGNADGMGRTLNYWSLERAFPLAQVFGWLPCLVDVPAGPSNELGTEADRKAAGVKPFVTAIAPMNFVDWQVSNGKFDWAIIREEFLKPTGDPTTRGGNDKEVQYKVWTPEWWAVYDGEAKPKGDLEKNEHKLKEVPIAVALNEESTLYDWPIGISAIGDIADLNREIYNQCSLLQEFLYKQCFAQLVLDAEMVGKIIELGQSNAIPKEGEQADPFFLAPPIAPAEFIDTRIDKLVQEIYRLSVVRDTTVVQGAAESGISKAYDFHDAQQNMARKSKNMEEFEKEIMRYTGLWLGSEVNKEELEITWPDEFDVKTLNEEIAEITEIFKSDIGSVTLNRELAKGVVSKMFSDEKMVQKIHDELDKVDPGLSFEEQRVLVEKAAMSTLDWMRRFRPDASDEELQTKFDENIEINKKFLKAVTSPGNGETPPETKQKIRDRLEKRGIKVEE